MRGRGDSRSACAASSLDRVPIMRRGQQDPAYFVASFFSCAAFASLTSAASSSLRLWTSSFRVRRPCVEPTAYSQNNGNAIVESQYATTVSGRTLGFTLPQLTASEGVAPERPPQTT